jgi:hypothetical protein
VTVLAKSRSADQNPVVLAKFLPDGRNPTVLAKFWLDGRNSTILAKFRLVWPASDDDGCTSPDSDINFQIPAPILTEFSKFQHRSVPESGNRCQIPAMVDYLSMKVDYVVKKMVDCVCRLGKMIYAFKKRKSFFEIY